MLDRKLTLRTERDDLELHDYLGGFNTPHEIIRLGVYERPDKYLGHIVACNMDFWGAWISCEPSTVEEPDVEAMAEGLRTFAHYLLQDADIYDYNPPLFANVAADDAVRRRIFEAAHFEGKALPDGRVLMRYVPAEFEDEEEMTIPTDLLELVLRPVPTDNDPTTGHLRAGMYVLAHTHANQTDQDMFVGYVKATNLPQGKQFRGTWMTVIPSPERDPKLFFAGYGIRGMASYVLGLANFTKPPFSIVLADIDDERTNMFIGAGFRFARDMPNGYAIYEFDPHEPYEDEELPEE